MSRNIAAVKVAEQTGYDRVVVAVEEDQGRRSDQVKPYPSIALGVVELTPLEVAEAYTVFPNRGTMQQAARDCSASRAARTSPSRRWKPGPTVARPTTAFLVTHMMRSVLNEGTGAGARANGFTLDAAGKSGTTNDLRDAWFVGFTPELLTVVWVGLDDNQPLGLSGAQAALPIWTSFMKNAAGRARHVAVRGAGRASASSRSIATPARSPRRSARASPTRRSSPAPSRSPQLRAAPAGRRVAGLYIVRIDEPRSLRRARRGALPRRRSRARDDRLVQRLDAAARRREDARLRATAASSAPSAAAATSTTPSARRGRCCRPARPTTVKYDLNDDFAEETGLVCGGQMEVFIEPIEAAPAVYIFGAGHVGYYLAQVARTRPASACTSSTIAPRSPTPSASRSPPRSSSTTFRRGWRRRQFPPTAYAVIVTRGHRNDLDALRGAGAARAALHRPDRQPRQGRAPLRAAAGRRPRRPERCSNAFTRRSGSTSAP